ncbi:hypothetical protein EUGRSUZ_F02010 [Eucalyptus grandis]|uniref:NADH:quinone oxidoreductase/Mrp antiporter transmembrane domain-containing protein n=2 Tax=Eucalyptus grandis TaxID=71139 RepID=A0A059BR20_EUCGR|nr:hypothetical protein EUGRSUZ_F02010 [Eucalyptus grandis]
MQVPVTIHLLHNHRMEKSIRGRRSIDAFAIVSALRQTCVKYIANLGALAKTNPILAITFSITMFSYARIPPLVGYCSKFYVFFIAIPMNNFLFFPVDIKLVGTTNNPGTTTGLVNEHLIIKTEKPSTHKTVM